MLPMELVVTEKHGVASDTVLLRLQRPDGGVLPGTEPGAHLALELNGLVRRYSVLQADAAPRHYAIGVQFAQDSRGGSRFVHERLTVGDRLPLLEVANDFQLDACAPHSLLIGGGIGITPLLGMAGWLQSQGRSFALHQVVRHQERAWPLPASLQAQLHVGRAGLALEPLLDAQPAGGHVYVCGPRGLVDAVHAAASRLGWTAGRVHTESFGAMSAEHDVPLRVTLKQSGLTLNLLPGTSLLDALLANGVWIGYDCRRGACGSCLAGVVQGQPIHRDSLAADLRAGGLCTCVSWAEGPELVLDL